MKITEKWLEQHKACANVRLWFRGQKETDAEAVVSALVSERLFSWANWLLTCLLKRDDVVRFAAFAAARAAKSAEDAASAYWDRAWDARSAKTADDARAVRAARADRYARAAALAAEHAAEDARAVRAVRAARYASLAAGYSADASGADDNAAADAAKKELLAYGMKLLKGEKK